MSEDILAALAAASDPEEKAALVAEFTLADLPGEVAQVARSAVILHWFSSDIIAALLPADSSTPANEVYRQLAGLPFIEQLPLGLTFHQQTRAGMLNRLSGQQPDLLQKAAALAAPVYAAYEDKTVALEALYCYTLAGDTTEALKLLNELIYWAAARRDWATLLKMFDLRDEAEGYHLGEPLPRSVLHHFARGLAQQSLKQYEAALADYQRAIELNPEDATAYYNRGNTYHNLKQYEAALADYQRAIELNPEDATAYYNTACAYALQSQVEAVLPPLRRALELNVARYLELIPSDSDFDAIRDDPRFKALLAEFGAFD